MVKIVRQINWAIWREILTKSWRYQSSWSTSLNASFAFQASNRSTSPQKQQHKSDDIHYNGSAVKENQSLKSLRSAIQKKMEKPSTQKSTVSPATTANERTPKENTHHRLPMNSSASMNKTMPITPQRNLIHSTSPQNQCVQHSKNMYRISPDRYLNGSD